MKAIRPLSALVAGLVFAVVGASENALGSPYYCRYDAEETYPEQQGWDRLWDDPVGGLHRTLEGGVLTIDSFASPQIYDTYLMSDEDIQPGTGETLTVKWHMRTLRNEPEYAYGDTAVTIVNEQQAYASFRLEPDLVYESGAGTIPPHEYAITEGEWHEYEFVTSDMTTYALYVDDVLAFESSLYYWSGTPGPLVTFGDQHWGVRSISERDYIEMCVVPEPGGMVLGPVMFCAVTYSVR